MTPEPDNQRSSQPQAATTRRWSRDLSFAFGLATLAFALLALAGLARVAGATDEAWGDVGTLAAAPPVAAPPAPQADTGSVRVPAPGKAAGPRWPRPDPAWVNRVAGTTGIPARALTAYAQASLLLADKQPSCRASWNTLAAISRIESGHGTLGGNHLRDDGRPAVPILGPALDGSPGFAAIRATPRSTALHGDPTWDHAIGPMQFIPSTWERWASDGDGDGRSDLQDIDDAAYAAGRYLCASGADLTTGEGWQRATLSYNHSDEYVAAVLDAANRYARDSRKG
jgi:Transglycosylase SLT domain